METYNLSIVLVTPEIPTNTGTIGRLCLATNSTLHLVYPLGFKIDSSRVKRAGLDYWKYLKIVEHKNIDEFFDSVSPKNQIVFFSTKAKKSYFEKKFKKNSYLVFGSETKGLGSELLEKFPEKIFKIPQYDNLHWINVVLAGVV